MDLHRVCYGIGVYGVLGTTLWSVDMQSEEHHCLYGDTLMRHVLHIGFERGQSREETDLVLLRPRW